MVLKYVKVNTSLALISVARIEDLLHQRNLLDDMSRGKWLDRGRQHIEQAQTIVIACEVVVSHLHRLELL